MLREQSDMPAAPGADAHHPHLQQQTLLTVVALAAQAGECRGKLALCLGAGQASCGAALAVSTLGGGCLVLERDAARLTSAGRLGATDFTVTGLSEALRILKNELRRRLPVSVGVAGEPKTLVAEMVQRGVQPDLVFGSAEETKLLRPFVTHGAAALVLPVSLPEELQHGRILVDHAEDGAGRRKRDRNLATMLALGAHGAPEFVRQVQSLWLASAPRLFPRDRGRVYLDWRADG